MVRCKAGNPSNSSGRMTPMQMDEAPKPRRAISPLFILLAWILFTLGVFALGYPRVSPSSLVSSGVLQYARIGEDSPLPSTQVRTVQVSFITASGEQQLVSLQTKTIGEGANTMTVMKHCLRALRERVLSSGLVSYINPGDLPYRSNAVNTRFSLLM